MKKTRKILAYVWIGSLVLAFVAIFMGFLNALNIQHYSSHQWHLNSQESIYYILFKDTSTLLTNRGVLLAAMVCLIVAVLMGITITILNGCKIINKKLNLGFTISIMGLLTVSAMFMYFMSPIIRTDYLCSKWYIVTLGAGSLCWAILASIAVIGLGASIFINKKLLKGLY